VFNIEDDGDNENSLVLNQPEVTVNGTTYTGRTAVNGGDPVRAEAVQKNFNQTVIWNIMDKGDIQLNAFGGAVLAPVAKSVTLQTGNSSGWIVTSGTVNMNNQFHFVYSGASRDAYGQMHFSLTKAFTQNFAKHGEVVQDTSIDIHENEYQFAIQEYKSEGPAKDELNGRGELKEPYGDPQKAFVNTDGILLFDDSLTFTCLKEDSSWTEEMKHYNIQKPDAESSDETNEKMFYFRISEISKSPAGIENSDGYIDIRLKVEVDKNGKFTYFVDYMSVTGKDPATGENIVFREYGADYKDADHPEKITYIKMSGVQFDLGAFYNRNFVPGYITLTKTIAGNKPEDLSSLTFVITDNDGFEKTYHFSDFVEDKDNNNNYNLNQVIVVPDSQKTYTITETVHTISGYSETVSYQVQKTVTDSTKTERITQSGDGDTAVINLSSTDIENPVSVTFTDTYKQNGTLVITKTISDAPLNALEIIHFDVVNSADKNDKLDIPDLKFENVGNGEKQWKKQDSAGVAGKEVYTYTVTGLEADKTYTVTERYNNSETSTYKLVTEGSNSSVTYGEATIPAGGEANVDITDNYIKNPGKLVITKTISGAPLNELETISFDVVNSADANDKLEVTDLKFENVGTGEKQWKKQPSPAGKEIYTYTITGLEADKKYNVTETYNGNETSTYKLITEGSNSSVTFGDATIIAGGEVNVDITNNFVKNPGTLVITKTISDAPLNELETLHFDVVNAADANDKLDIPDLKFENVGTGDKQWKKQTSPAG
ncbi:MAG: hypothetical protein IKM72_16565, partial [Oscillospiraceae bacterium]|nr:hypothetical protein [Oscillospiraceae bacterium]